MARPEPEMATTCDHCGEPFTTSQVHPRKYCSIACEEGRGPLPMDDPQSPDYHLHLKGNPEDLVGKAVLAVGFKRVDYSPDWAKGPHYTTPTSTVWVDEEEEVYLRETDVYLGEVVEYGADGYVIEHENLETGEITERTVHDFLMVEQIRNDRWWVDG